MSNRFFGNLAALCAVAMLSTMLAHAQERKAYKVVDKNGNITYSQTPPVDGQDAQKVVTKPAMAGRGGSTNSYSPHDDPRHYSGQSTYNPNSSGQRQPTPRDQRLAALKAECERQRGTDCNNPAALQYMDSTSIPRRGH